MSEPNNQGGIKEPFKVNVGPEGLFTGQKISSAIEKFVERGDDPEDLILRSDFMDFDQGTAWCRQLRKARHFHDKEEEQMLINYLAMLPAVQGKRIDILKDAVIGAHSTQDKKSIGFKLKNLMGMGGDKDNQNNG